LFRNRQLLFLFLNKSPGSGFGSQWSKFLLLSRVP